MTHAALAACKRWPRKVACRGGTGFLGASSFPIDGSPMCFSRACCCPQYWPPSATSFRLCDRFTTVVASTYTVTITVGSFPETATTILQFPHSLGHQRHIPLAAAYT